MSYDKLCILRVLEAPRLGRQLKQAVVKKSYIRICHLPTEVHYIKASQQANDSTLVFIPSK
jgi:hypothetical protein